MRSLEEDDNDKNSTSPISGPSSVLTSNSQASLGKSDSGIFSKKKPSHGKKQKGEDDDKSVVIQPVGLVTVYIWLPSKEDKNVGHVSLQTQKIDLTTGVKDEKYISFWPVKTPKSLKSEFFQLKPSFFSQSLAKDIHYVGDRGPDDQITLHKLNVDLISQEYDNILNSPKPIAFQLLDQNKTATNCSGMAFRLLAAGGIRKFLPKPSPTLMAFFTNPSEQRGLLDYLGGDLTTYPGKIQEIVKYARATMNGKKPPKRDEESSFSNLVESTTCIIS